MDSGKKFYGWKVVFTIFVVMFTLYPPLLTSISIYTRPIINEYGFDVSTFLLYNTVKAIFTIIGTLLVDPFLRRFGSKKTLIIGIVFSVIGLLGFAISKTLLHFYFFSSFMGMGLALTCMVIPGIAMTNWFNEKRGTALGIALSGSGLGGSIYSPLGTYIINNFGWRQAYLFTAIMIVAVTLVIVLIMFKEKPSDIGQMPYGSSQKSEIYGFTNSQMLRMPSFYTFAILILLVNFIANGITINYANYFEGFGYDSTKASMFLSLGLFSVTVGKLLLGFLIDMFGLEKTTILNGILASLQCVFLLAGAMFLPSLVFSVFYGITAASCSVFPPIFTEYLFGNREFAKKFGIATMLLSVANAIIPVIIGFVHKIFGNQNASIIMFIGFGVLYLVFAIITLKIRKDPQAIKGEII